jgi:hypothetical protein
MDRNYQELVRQVEELRKEVARLGNASQIPFDVEMALRERLGIGNVVSASVSSKDANSEDITIDESGGAIKVALNDPVGFIAIELNNTTYQVPYYTA